MEYQIQVENIKCGGCARSVRKNVLRTEGVVDVNVDPADGVITITGSEEIDMEELKSGLASIGYPETGKGNNMQKVRSYVSCMIGRMDSD